MKYHIKNLTKNVYIALSLYLYFLIMKRFFFGTFWVLIVNTAIAQPTDSVEFYLNAFNYTKVIALLQNDTNKTEKTFNTLGICHIKLGNTETAKTDFNRALSLDSTNKKALYYLGKLYFSESNFIASKYYWTQLFSTDTTNLYYLKLLAKVNRSMEDYPNATTQLQALITRDSNDLSSVLALSHIYFLKKQYEQIDSLLSGYSAQLQSHRKLLLLFTKTQYLLNHYDKALESAQQYLSNFPENTAIQKIQGLSFYQTEQYDSCIHAIKQIRNYEKSHTLCYFVGMSYYKLSQFNDAEFFLNKAIEESRPNNLSDYYTYLAFSYDKTNHYALAIKALKEAYDLSHKKLILYFLATEYDKYYKDKRTAAKFYQKYIDENDTLNKDIMHYSQFRLQTIKEKLHFLNDSL